MPLKRGSSSAAVAQNYSTHLAQVKHRKQSVDIALSKAGKGKK